MASKRILRYVNGVILIALIVALAGVYWFVWRPLPKTSGTLKLPVNSSTTVVRDALGAPHITASSIEDALFLQGYATAQDRLWQMDTTRRLAAGRLAEVFGKSMLESDREACRYRMEHIAERSVAKLPPDERAALAAYARGVNAFIESHRGKLPVEFTLLRYEPGPWRISDSVLLGLYLYRSLTTSWREELQKAALLEGGDPAKVSYLFPARAAGGEVQPGSNAWVISGAHTAAGKPLLSNDPHLDYTLPSIWHMVHLKAPGLNVSGVTLPGLPCVILGHNDRIAWGVTNLQFDVQDLYIEKFDPQTGRYLYSGQIEQARLEREVIPVKDSAPEEFAVWITRHGPVLRDGNRFYALRWAGAEAPFHFPLLDLDRARNFQEFTAALSRYPGPGQNFVYADVDGNIGYQATGQLPVRRAHDGSVPVDGSTGQYEWDGFIAFDQLPRAYNPPSGMIVTANQDPFPASYPYTVTGNFAPPYRARQIRDLLSKRNNWRSEQMLTVQKDVYSGFSLFLARQVVAAWDRRGVRSPGLSEAIALLRKWDGQMESGPAPVIATLLFQKIKKAMAESASPGKGDAYDTPLNVGVSSVQLAPVVVERLLRERPSGWFADYDQMLLQAFIDAIEEGRRFESRNVEKWDYGKLNQLLIAHPVIGRLPWVGKYFNLGPVRQSGSGTSVKQTTRRLGPSMRMTVDLANLDNSKLNILAGESGQILSGHYKDQWDAWYYGATFPMQFRKVDAKNTLTVEPE